MKGRVDKLTSNKLFEAIYIILREYKRARFKVTLIHADNWFKLLFEEVEDELDVTFNFINPWEHKPYIEHHNRVSKERCRVIYHELPYRNVLKIMIKYLALDETRKMNLFPEKGGVQIL